MTDKSYKKISVELETSIYKNIRQTAFDNETTMKDIINTYLADGINRNKGQSKLD